MCKHEEKGLGRPGHDTVCERGGAAGGRVAAECPCWVLSMARCGCLQGVVCLRVPRDGATLLRACRSMVRHVLTNSPEMYGKGILAEIIEFIMGKVRAFFGSFRYIQSGHAYRGHAHGGLHVAFLAH